MKDKQNGKNSSIPRLFTHHIVWANRDIIWYNTKFKHFIIGVVNEYPPYFKCLQCKTSYYSLREFKQHYGKTLYSKKATQARNIRHLLITLKCKTKKIRGVNVAETFS